MLKYKFSRRVISFFLIFLLVFPFSFCLGASFAAQSSDGVWYTFQGNASHTGYVALDLDPSRFSLRWNKQSVEKPEYFSDSELTNPVVGQGNLYVVSGKTLSAVDGKDGHVVWENGFADDDSFKYFFSHGAVAYSEGKIFMQTYATDVGGELRAYNAQSGDILYKSPFSSQYGSYLNPTPFKGNIYIKAEYCGGVDSMKIDTGDKNWGKALPNYHNWTPAVSDDYVIAYGGPFGMATDPEEGSLFVLNLDSGDKIAEIKDPYYYQDPFEAADTAPVLDAAKGLAFKITGDHLSAFDLGSSSIRYRIENDCMGQPDLANGVLYLVNGDNLSAYSEENGELLWQWPISDYEIKKYPFIVTRNLIFISNETTTFAVDLDKHTSVWQYPVGGRLAISEDTLYIVTQEGMVYAFNIT